MIESPLNVLMRTIVPLLKADADLQAMIGTRVYDDVPKEAEFPYVSIGSAWETPDDADCLASVEIGFRLDVWSRSEIDLPEGALAMLEHRRSDAMRDPDGKTSHVAIEFTAVIET